MPDRKEIFKKLYLILPIFLIIVLMLVGVPVIHSALYGIVACIIVGMINKDTRIGFNDILDALVDGARTALAVVTATACAGIIVGVVVKTGLGLSLATDLVKLSRWKYFINFVLYNDRITYFRDGCSNNGKLCYYFDDCSTSYYYITSA